VTQSAEPNRDPAVVQHAADAAVDAASAPRTARAAELLADARALDESFMDLALAEAARARAFDEVPIGAVVVLDGRVIGRGFNRTRGGTDPTAHAELNAIADAARTVQAQRLTGATVYTTVEPCFMCAGALLHARIRRVVWGVRDEKFGACASLGAVLSDKRLNHQVVIAEGVRADQARAALQEFFREKRQAAQAAARVESDAAAASDPGRSRS
jgi:tRNA(adenine34) deaminase